MKTVSSLTAAYDISLITLTNIPNKPGNIAKVFQRIKADGINVDMISKTAPYRDLTNVSFTLSDEEFPKALAFLSQLKKEYPLLGAEVKSGSTKITVAGEGMRNTPGVAADVFQIIADCGGEIVLITTAETEISVLVDERDTDKIISRLKDEYDL